MNLAAGSYFTFSFSVLPTKTLFPFQHANNAFFFDWNDGERKEHKRRKRVGGAFTGILFVHLSGQRLSPKINDELSSPKIFVCWLFLLLLLLLP